MRCSHCGKESDPLFKFCLHCGRELAEKKKDAAPAPAPAKPAPAAPAPKPEPKPEPKPDPKSIVNLTTQPRVTQVSDARVTQIAVSRGPEDSATVNEMEAVVIPPEPEAGDDLLRCPRCRARVEEDARRCQLCGYALKPEPNEEAVAAARRPGRFYLVSVDTTTGTEVKRIPLLDGAITLGRKNCDINFEDDELLSPLHLHIQVKQGEVLLKCAGSLNGTYIKLDNPIALEHGDAFRMGQQVLRFEEMRFVEPLVRPADDGTRVMGSPTTTLVWGRVTQVLGSNLTGSSYILRGDEVVLGREKGDITFPSDRYMSGRHGSITRRVDGYFLNDLGSSNGTFVRLKGAQPVRPGQYIVAGRQLLRFE